MNKKLLIAILAIVVAGLVWYFFYRPINIPADWESYSSETVGFSIKYDPSLIVSEDSETDVRFYKIGPTQQGQTEMYDGIVFSVRRVAIIEEQQLYIDTQIEQFKEVGTITEPLHDISINGVSAKEFGASGLGDFKIIFVPVDDKTFIEISYITPDPTNIGFQKIVETILSTFKLK